MCLGNEKIVELLLDNGADLERIDQRGIRMLDRVIVMNNAAVVTVFLKKGGKAWPLNMESGRGKI